MAYKPKRGVGSQHVAETRGRDGSSVDAHDTKVVKGDVVQVEPDHKLFPCCFAVVTEAKGWGIVVDVYGHSKALYPTRLASNQFVRIGVAEWTLEYVA